MHRKLTGTVLRLAFGIGLLQCDGKLNNPFKTFRPPVKAAIIQVKAEMWQTFCVLTRTMMSVLTCRSHIYISKWGICDTERAAALLNNCQPVWLLQGELTWIQMLTHFFPSPCPLGGTVTTPLICCWCIHSSCCRKWAWKWEEMCVTLAFFDNSRQRTSGILFPHDIRGLFISALLHNILTWYKAW